MQQFNSAMRSYAVLLALCTSILIAGALHPSLDTVPIPPNDVVIGGKRAAGPLAEFKYTWVASDGTVYPDEAPGRLEVAATLAITTEEHNVGTFIVTQMIRNMPPEVFNQLAAVASVGLFTADDKTTIFPEYEHLKDRPECAGTCAGACSDTCTGDGRKYDSLAGLGGIRGTCLDDNFMCTAADPYFNTYSVLVHEFAHTIHQYGLWGVTDYYDRIYAAYINALNNNIWDRNSYAMSNELEYFAEGAGVFFNANHHCCSNGGMNSCGIPGGFCQSETDARNWLWSQDPQLYDALSYTFTNHQPSIPGGLAICVV